MKNNAIESCLLKIRWSIRKVIDVKFMHITILKRQNKWKLRIDFESWEKREMWEKCREERKRFERGRSWKKESEDFSSQPLSKRVSPSSLVLNFPKSNLYKNSKFHAMQTNFPPPKGRKRCAFLLLMCKNCIKCAWIPTYLQIKPKSERTHFKHSENTRRFLFGKRVFLGKSLQLIPPRL